MKQVSIWWWGGIGFGTLFVVGWWFAVHGLPRGPLAVSFLDVGQGDATLVQYMGNVQVLVDGGPDQQLILTNLSRQIPAYDRNIELVMVTHPDYDHLNGLISVLRHYRVGMILASGAVSDSVAFQEFQQIIADKGIPYQILGEGSTVRVGRYLTLSVLHPDTRPNERETNKISLVTNVVYGEHSFLLTGDIDTHAEEDMIHDKEPLDAEWLKIAHHGSKISTSELFLNHVTPTYAVISVGENSYGHPTQEVLDRLAALHVDTLRTDTMGTITVACGSQYGTCAVASSGK